MTFWQGSRFQLIFEILNFKPRQDRYLPEFIHTHHAGTDRKARGNSALKSGGDNAGPHPRGGGSILILVISKYDFWILHGRFRPNDMLHDFRENSTPLPPLGGVVLPKMFPIVDLLKKKILN